MPSWCGAQVKSTGKIQVEVFWVVTPCSVTVGYRHLGGTCCLHLHPEDLDLNIAVDGNPHCFGNQTNMYDKSAVILMSITY
jgi:hypothetical protein